MNNIKTEQKFLLKIKFEYLTDSVFDCEIELSSSSSSKPSKLLSLVRVAPDPNKLSSSSSSSTLNLTDFEKKLIDFLKVVETKYNNNWLFNRLKEIYLDNFDFDDCFFIYFYVSYFFMILYSYMVFYTVNNLI